MTTAQRGAGRTQRPAVSRYVYHVIKPEKAEGLTHSSVEQGLADAWRVREQVFVQEQGIDPALEHDNLDAEAVHVVAYTVPEHVPVATGRLLLGQPAKIGRMAVLAQHRRRGLGAAVLTRLIQAARKCGVQEVIVHAQEQAVPFYLANGFQPVGEPFYEAGIRHLLMVKSIPLVDRTDPAEGRKMTKAMPQPGTAACTTECTRRLSPPPSPGTAGKPGSVVH